MTTNAAFYGPNMAYVLELYEHYRQDPASLDEGTRRFFEHWQPPHTNGSSAAAISEAGIDTAKVIGAINLAAAIRQFGHMAAQLDPLGTPPQGDPSLTLAAHGLTEADLRALPASIIHCPMSNNATDAFEVVEDMRRVYSGTIGYDIEHITNPDEREWLRDAIENRRYRYEASTEQDRALLNRFAQIEAFEMFLQKQFPTKYRFSIEGLDTLVPMLDEIVTHSAGVGTENVMIAMAHRGRLNVLAHVLQKPYDRIIADFVDLEEAAERLGAIGSTIDDVKYHKAWEKRIDLPGGKQVTLSMPPNPSHLEAVNPVAEGMARAAGTSVNQRGPAHYDPYKTMQVLIHGDAAFPGQGIVAETFNLSRLPGYWTGGTIHFIANNQIGFTTLPGDGRSTSYASDLAKGYKVPVIHVNADDPAACIEVARLAFAYQQKFEKDVLVDLIGYRRYGHNELDEPGFTQPMLYEVVRGHEPIRKLWLDAVSQRGSASADDAEAMMQQHAAAMQAAYEAIDPEALYQPHAGPPQGIAAETDTAISEQALIALNNGLSAALDGFNFYSKRLEKAIRARRSALADLDTPAVDWATAEELAFASILADGIAIRLTGQDSERGTFSHRHSVLHDAESGQTLIPLHELPQARAALEVRNSPLSEAAVLGFEFGYNVQSRDRLVIWEAQYGDFINGAQTIVDEFIVSAREKWSQLASLVMLLPHGHEGAGPDHSSGRLERFLQMAAKTNLRIANCTTTAQYFHLLRRQALLLAKDPLPLIVMSPKSLLRNPDVYSTGRELVDGRWQPVIDDAEADPLHVERVVFVSGKFYLDLVKSEYRQQYSNTAIVRVEQLYPFPAQALHNVIQRYPNVKQIVWAQEEPKNMGAWEFMGYRVKKLVGPSIPVNYVGRRRSSSPAEGSRTAHNVNQAKIIEYAFDWDFQTRQAEPIRG